MQWNTVIRKQDEKEGNVNENARYFSSQFQVKNIRFFVHPPPWRHQVGQMKNVPHKYRIYVYH